MLVQAASFSDYILAVHILGVVIAFGVTFAYPLLFAAAAGVDPTVMPWLLRSRQRIGRFLVNPGLLIVVLAGVYLASDLHQWGTFYVPWGIGAVIVIGGIEGSVINPRSGRLAKLAERDLAAAAVPAGGQRVSAQWSPEYRAGFRQLAMAGWVLDAIVVVTVFVMATHA